MSDVVCPHSGILWNFHHKDTTAFDRLNMHFDSVSPVKDR